MVGVVHCFNDLIVKLKNTSVSLDYLYFFKASCKHGPGCVYEPHAVGTGTRGRGTLLVWFALGFLRQGITLFT